MVTSLIQAFARGAQVEAGALAQDAVLLAELAQALDRARSEHPVLASRAGFDDGFVEYLAARLPGHRSFADEVAALHAGDLALARACGLGDSGAVSLFERDVLVVGRGAAKRLSMEPSEGEELLQLVRTKLLAGGPDVARIGSYAGSGPLRSWVYATTLRTGLNELRRKGRAPVPTGDEELLVAMPDDRDDQELRYMKELYRNEFQGAFRKAIAELPVRLANVLRHYYLDEMTLEEVGRLYNVHKTTAMRWVNRAHAELEAGTKSHLMERLSLSRGDVDSVVRLIQSGIHIGLASALMKLDSEA